MILRRTMKEARYAICAWLKGVRQEKYKIDQLFPNPFDPVTFPE